MGKNIHIVLPDLNSITVNKPKTIVKINDIMYALMLEPTKPAFIIPFKVIRNNVHLTSDAIQKSTNWNTPPIQLVQLVVWENDTDIYVSFVEFDVATDNSAGYNIIPKPPVDNATLKFYIGRIVGQSGTLNAPYTPYVCTDTDFNFSNCKIAGIINIETNRGRTHEPANIGPLAAIIIALVATAGITGGISWVVTNISHDEAEKVKAMSTVERERLLNERLNLIKELVSDLKENIQDNEDLANVITNLFGTQGYLGKFLAEPPTDNNDDNYSRNNDWWSGIFEFIKQMIPYAIGIVGLMVIVMKFNILQKLVDMIRKR